MGGGGRAHAERCEEDEHRIFSAHRVAEIAWRNRDADKTRRVDDELCKSAEVVNRERAGKDRRIGAEEVEQQRDQAVLGPQCSPMLSTSPCKQQRVSTHRPAVHRGHRDDLGRQQMRFEEST